MPVGPALNPQMNNPNEQHCACTLFDRQITEKDVMRVENSYIGPGKQDPTGKKSTRL